MAKQKTSSKTAKKTTVTPSTVGISVGVKFDTLKEGDCFIMSNKLWIKIQEAYCDQAAINLITGEIADDLCGLFVIPVIAAITWKKK